MKLAQFVKRVTPPVLLDIFSRNRRRDQHTGNLWEGIYSQFKDVPAAGPRFDGSIWIEKTNAYTGNVLASSKKYGSVPTEVVGEHMLLPLLASLVCKESGGKVRILDFGGGMGITYVHLMSSLVDCNSVDYHVVEREGVCESGAKLFKDDARIHFSSEIPAGLTEVDIVYMSSALQYVESYHLLLERLCALGARYFLFVKLSAGDFPTYATAQQNVPGTTLPYWFVNVGEIVKTMEGCGYALMYKSALEQEYDQSNFPEAYRMGRACNLLFSRN